MGTTKTELTIGGRCIRIELDNADSTALCNCAKCYNRRVRESVHTWAITVAPKAEWHNISMKLQFEFLVQKMLDVRIHMNGKIKFMYTTELTKLSNIHFHGIFTASTQVWYYRYINALRRIGIVCVKPNPSVGWYEYMFKDYDLMCEIVGEPYFDENTKKIEYNYLFN